ncbi:MAG: adenylate/guanylate cyclase domain-containing protein [Rhodomicrobium sp.]
MAFKRRLATILSADVTGFCRLMGQDDELTLGRLINYREVLSDCVAQKDGQLFGVAGDSSMAEFASPVAAVRCGIEFQRAIEAQNEDLPENRRIHFRVGIHTGDVIVENSGLFGDDVNIAARLQELCKPGHLVLSEAVFRLIFGKVDLKFKALGPQQLKNIPVAVSAFAAEAANVPLTVDDLLPPVSLSQPVPGFHGRPAIAVLPFEIYGGSGADEYLGEGFADDLINGLSNVRTFPVISRTSSFIFKHHALDARSIGVALGARYLVTGSVRFAGPNLRLTVNLIDSGNGLNLATRTYRIVFGKLFEVQDEITASIVSILDSDVERAERSRSFARKPEDLDTWELIRKGTWHQYKFTKEDAALARSMLDEALKRDPNSTEARIQLAWWYFWDVWTKRGDLSVLSKAEELARQAVSLDRFDARAHALTGIAIMLMGRPEQARPHYETAIELNPSLAVTHASLGSSYILGGEPEKAVDPLLLSIRLNPHDVYSFHTLGELAVAFYMQEEWLKACEFAERSLQSRAGYWYARAIRIAAFARSGRLAFARELATRASPDLTREKIYWLPFVDKKWNDNLLDGLKLAGLTEI